ncbi:MAG: aspartate aminotransferase family protein, partial [Chloroflexi bacterium]|nr:aspartate aminotransferase family protein [Chloroflexota bacterium]
LKLLKKPGTYAQLGEMGTTLAQGLAEAAAQAEVPIFISRLGSLLTPFFTDSEVTDYDTARTSNTQHYSAFFHAMLERGIYLPPSQFEAIFVSLAHNQGDIQDALHASTEAFRQVKAV